MIPGMVSPVPVAPVDQSSRWWGPGVSPDRVTSRYLRRRPQPTPTRRDLRAVAEPADGPSSLTTCASTGEVLMVSSSAPTGTTTPLGIMPTGVTELGRATATEALACSGRRPSYRAVRDQVRGPRRRAREQSQPGTEATVGRTWAARIILARPGSVLPVVLPTCVALVAGDRPGWTRSGLGRVQTWLTNRSSARFGSPRRGRGCSPAVVSSPAARPRSRPGPVLGALPDQALEPRCRLAKASFSPGRAGLTVR
jgi:hypothetical protein